MKLLYLVRQFRYHRLYLSLSFVSLPAVTFCVDASRLAVVGEDLIDPGHQGADLGVDPGEVGLGTALAPGHDALQLPVAHQRAARVPLSRVDGCRERTIEE